MFFDIALRERHESLREAMFSTLFVDFPFVRKLREPSEVPCLSVKIKVRLFPRRVDSLARSDLEKRRELSPKLTIIVKNTCRKGFASEPRDKNSIFSLPDDLWRRFWSPRRAPGRSRASFLASRGALGDPSGTPGARRGRSGTLPGRSGDAFGTLLHATGSPERVQAAILSRFWVPQGVSRH